MRGKDMGTKSSLVQQLGFTVARRRALLLLIGFTPADHAHAVYLHRHVLLPDTERIVAAFYRKLGNHPDVRQILASGFVLAHLQETQRQYLLTLGIGFDSASYFESRLRIGATHARVSVPLSLYQAAYSLLQRLILARLRVRLRRSPRRQPALVEYLIKIATLDMSLAIETYHNARVGNLQNSIKVLRDRAVMLHRRAAIDPFTGVAHHARILAVLQQALTQRHGRPLSIVLADLDRFKAVNDSCGHLAGDKVLQTVTAHLRSIARHEDVVGRYGGDEFIIVLKGTPLATARTIAERMRADIERNAVDVGNRRLKVTLSAGVAAARRGDDVESLVARADAALYEAKRKGRNRVIVSASRKQAPSTPRHAKHLIQIKAAALAKR